MNMDNISDIERDMDELRQVFPDPLGLPSNADVFFNHPTTKKLVARGQQSVALLLRFLENGPDPSLVRPTVLLLSRFAPPTFYPTLLGLLEKADQPTTEAFEFGLWLVQVPEAQIARDRLLESQELDRLVLDHHLHPVDLGVGGDHRGRLFGVDLGQRLDRTLNLTLDLAAHQDEIPAQVFELLGKMFFHCLGVSLG